MQALGIDYGEKRVGLAYGDSIGVAVPIPAITSGTTAEKIRKIADVVRQRRIDTLVIGYPYNMDGSVGFKAKEVDKFVGLIEAATGLVVHRIDERLTSHQVESEMRAAGRKLRQARKLRSAGDVDSRAAALILQDYLDMHQTVDPDLLSEDEELF